MLFPGCFSTRGGNQKFKDEPWHKVHCTDHLGYYYALTDEKFEELRCGPYDKGKPTYPGMSPEVVHSVI
jgi:hypothetical protein